MVEFACVVVIARDVSRPVTLGLSVRRAGWPFVLRHRGVNRFVFGGGVWRLETWGEVQHLAGLATRDDDAGLLCPAFLDVR